MKQSEEQDIFYKYAKKNGCFVAYFRFGVADWEAHLGKIGSEGEFLFGGMIGRGKSCHKAKWNLWEKIIEKEVNL